jgi:hypothetical protein
LLAHSPAEASAIFDRLKKLYDARSAGAHGGKDAKFDVKESIQLFGRALDSVRQLWSAEKITSGKKISAQIETAVTEASPLIKNAPIS